MQSILALGLLIASTLSMAAPVSYNELQPSERALVDATNLICAQYTNRAWVLIGTLKVDCPAAASKEKRDDTPFNIDAGWTVEYAGNI